MTIFEKIKALFGKSAAEDSAHDEPTRRRFLRQLVTLTGGVATGLILPTRTLVILPTRTLVIMPATVKRGNPLGIPNPYPIAISSPLDPDIRAY